MPDGQEKTVKIMFRRFPTDADQHKGLEMELTQLRNLGGWEVKGTSVLITQNRAHIMYTLETAKGTPDMTGMSDQELPAL